VANHKLSPLRWTSSWRVARQFYKTAILSEAERLTYHFFAERFGPFLRHLDEA